MSKLILPLLSLLITAVTILSANADSITAQQAVTLADAFPTLAFDAPVDIAHADDERLFIVEQQGVVRVILPNNGATTAPTFLDISPRVTAGGERGLLGLAFHPQYRENGSFYLNYTHTRDGQLFSRISRFTVTADPNVADPASERVLLEVAQPDTNHNGGDLSFGPDGYLYIAMGDGGGAGDPENHAQRLDTLLGKLLRIDVDREENGRFYAIPPDNPFLGQPGRDEIWAYGLRNPWRFSFDRQTGDLYIGDVGQSAWEEINFQPANAAGGFNYGWRLKEGNACFNPPSNCDPGGLIDPIHAYSHDVGCSVTGGFVYRGASFPALGGTYLYADFCSGTIWGLSRVGENTWHNRPLAQVEPSVGIATFGEDAGGEVYVAQRSTGIIYRITGLPQTTWLPVVVR